MAGRPTKLSAKRTKAICDSIALGCPHETAAKANDIHPVTLWRWKERGEAVLAAMADGAKEDELPAQDRLAAGLCRGIEKAEADAEERMLRVVSHAALGAPAELDENGREIRAEQKPQWTAAMTYLERKYPQRWARRVHVRDETPRDPAPIDAERVRQFDAAFRDTYAAELPDVDLENLMPPIALLPAGEPEDNGHRGNGAGP